MQLYVRQTFLLVTLASTFIGLLVSTSIVGLTKFITFDFQHPISLPIGLIPFPLMILSIDLITELYGPKVARIVIFMGLIANLCSMLCVFLLGMIQQPFHSQELGVGHSDYMFYQIRLFTISSVSASLFAFLCSQLVEVTLYQFIKTKTKEKWLWFRNLGATIVSQMLDTFIVLSMTLLIAHRMNDSILMVDFNSTLLSCYSYKVVATVLLMPAFYLCVYLSKKLMFNGLDKKLSYIALNS